MNQPDARYPEKFRDALLDEVRRRLFEESIPRIKKCLAELTEPEIWHRPNENTASIGNLVLHLLGNVRQWICSGLGKAPDRRRRQLEFDEPGPVPLEKLLTDLDTLEADVEKVLASLEPADLLAIHPVQVFRESGISILVHVTEHFSYHTGQITREVKSRKNVDMKYYTGVNLNTENEMRNAAS